MENKVEQEIMNTSSTNVEGQPSADASTKVEEQPKVEENKKNEEKKSKKEKKPKKPRRPFKVVMKTWSKGLSKETSRITWEKKSQVIKDFVVIVVVSVILAILFFAIDMIIITIRK